MAKVGSVDKYANVMIGSVTQTVANTLTFQQLPQVTTLLEKKAYLINKVIYRTPRSLLSASGDTIHYGLSLSDRWTTVVLTEPTIIDLNTESVVDHGVAANAVVLPDNVVSDFSTLPGGGLIVPTRPLFLWVNTASIATTASLYARIYFTVLDLTPADYWDLVESLQAFA